MSTGLAAALIPHLVRADEEAFNVFRVLHHGTHEKQLSNLFAWLLKPTGSHGLGDLGLRAFIEIVQVQEPSVLLGPPGQVQVFQEVGVRDRADIADILVLTDSAAFVIENYFTSDGHEHSYDDYIKHGGRYRDNSVAVLLCGRREAVRQTKGWDKAPVVTYRDWIASVTASLPSNFPTKRPAQHWLLHQMDNYFVKGVRTVKETHDLVALIGVLADRGLDAVYRSPQGADQLMRVLTADVDESFARSRDLLQDAKSRLKRYCDEVLIPALNAELGDGYVSRRPKDYSGIYQWTINLRTASGASGTKSDGGPGVVQIKWGPSASHAIARDPDWRGSWQSTEAPNYATLFLTFDRKIVPSRVSLAEVVSDLSPSDTRLVDEVRNLLASSR